MKASTNGALRALSIVVLGAVSVIGCGGGVKDDPILRLSSEEAFEAGKKLMADEKYEQAREYFSHAFQTSPNSEIGRDALLLQADAYFLAAGDTNLIRAESKYRDFNNRYPTSDKASYVQHKVAETLEKRMRKPDRDQGETHKAIAAYDELLTLYPTSEEAALAEDGIARLRLNLAEHEYLVARYQFRRGLPVAAVSRLEYMTEEFPEYPEKDKVLCLLARANAKAAEPTAAIAAAEKLRSEHAGSEHCKDFKAPPPPPPEPVAEEDEAAVAEESG